jgi:HSP20 family protein
MTDATPNDADRTAESRTPPLDRVRHEMERWLEVAKSTGERALETLGLVATGRPALPDIDVVESDVEVVVSVDLPGVAADAVQLSLVGNMLTVKASRPAAEIPATSRRHVFERTASAFDRAIPLPAAVDVDAIHAETRDGVLTVTLKKSVASPGRSIPVSRATKPADTI